ncbi:MAG: YgiQ family radical SAM protein [Candidatus Cloacimonetes bacterium]|nr:YgiQ family radical SAM protein [Candidatus Cloacimonadota bacterium]
MNHSNFLPINKKDLQKRKIQQLDIIIITGDAYVDHPSFGPVIIARFLESHGYTVGIISQPDINNDNDFVELGRPKLFFGISSGNMDSMINHYTAQKKIRSQDAYSPDGKIGLRPDRAVIKYSQIVKRLFKGVPIILGGTEASLRRIPHYDFWSDKIRNSILFDSQADILVYGMGEKQILQIAQLLETKNLSEITEIKGTVVKIRYISQNDRIIFLPEYDKLFNKKKFWQMSQEFENFYRTKTIMQKFSGFYLKHNPPAMPLEQKELDNLYSLPYSRKPHPKYKKSTIKAFEQIKLSITSHRGCFGGCNFCSIGYHQGKTIQSRSIKSIISEIETIKRKDYFHGSISDIGGPSSNMYQMTCKIGISRTCKRNSCIYPKICENLDHSHSYLKKLLRTIKKDDELKNIFVASGIRFDLALKDEDYIKLISKNFTGGLLKLAPEHKSERVLKYMYKPKFDQYLEFYNKFRNFSKQVNKSQAIVPYIIVGHPGATLQDTIELAIYLKKSNVRLKQIQEFTPTPMTKSTMMYFTGLDDQGNKIHISKGRELKLQKALIQWFIPENRKFIIEALVKAKRKNLMRFFLNK